ncbi:MAG: phenylacetate--CoA ligase [Candidatus Raymondbacteria bacterium RifOxyA12_full_50_37]|nr:MAG: phenylacetate--CoA ligase [Candidatus Raymondbacteria bacterium RIFOXYA2_FULL_49_16]OGJ90112.1 MAG: phenylacetate--CoA ligase [Candidatus Raymondbacteria bacterium RifOxyA12_full_50_37]OGJ97690.1 MAG: phenylacetate--CoA ligase [Candidatus Raymondbacteria bacterium RIFOXYC2_FULL_50_21]OGP43647.1 MAG: phenylacetate--CoA ligase [Candidatus Raymondbacteria bacterium RIFOXYB2_FULL_49_35]
MSAVFWEKEVETLCREKLEALQLQRLRATIDQALKTPFYKKRLSQAGVLSGNDIASFGDVRKIPYTTKDDLRQGFPYGFLAVNTDDVIRLHTSSGTTGTPTAVYHTRDDIARWANLCARSLAATGASQRDVFQNMMTYGLFTGGLGLHYGAELLGMMVIPSGSGNTPRQLQLMRHFRTTAVHATPSYLLHLFGEIEKEGLTLSDLCLTKAYVGAEPHSEGIRRKIESLFGIDVYNSYGLSEMNGPGVAFECIAKECMHVWEDSYYAEIVDPGTLEALGPGREGELVLTALTRQATPILRYRTRDLTVIEEGQCACGRTHRRIARIKGRSDDMIIVNGVNIFPSQIEAVLMRVPEVGTNYQIYLDKQASLDRLTVKTEVAPEAFTGEFVALEKLRNHLKHLLKSEILVNPVVELHEPGALPVSTGKAVRVVDQRNEAYCG